MFLAPPSQNPFPLLFLSLLSILTINFDQFAKEFPHIAGTGVLPFDMTPTQTMQDFFRANPSILPYICIKFDPFQMRNLMTPVVTLWKIMGFEKRYDITTSLFVRM